MRRFSGWNVYLTVRVYISEDVIGVEVSGALKNVMALASGCLSGLLPEGQVNPKMAMITRALAEITRIGVKMGADPLTFAGLSGVGDLFLVYNPPF
jgi:glycerol-3-phosphate dehydrogenase (NAD(P)+)